jgi:hypothetical protein
VVEHSGGDHGYRSHLLWLPDQDVAVIALCNLSVMRPGELCRRVADVFLSDRIAGDQDEDKPIALDEEQLRRHAGTYHQTQIGTVRRLEVHDGHLAAALAPDLFVELVPVAPERFHATGYPVEVRFEETEGGYRMVETTGSEETVYLAVSPFEVASEDLSEYSGAYYSDELDVTYRVVRDGDGLLLHRRKFTDCALEPALRDTFTYRDASTLAFERDEQGGIAGFRLSAPRVWNMWFARVQSP